IFGWYRDRLAGRLALNTERDGCFAVYWMVCGLVARGGAAARDELCARLAARGIETRPFFTPMSRLPHLRSFRAVGVDGEGCPVARCLSDRGFNLPSGCGLEEADVDY